MTSFTIYPAIDLRHGRVVRLEQGDPRRQTSFHDDPLFVAQSWIAQGARWLHVINLDGAFEQAGRENWEILPELTRLKAKIQFGGGLRTGGDIERAFTLGVTRVILGTAAVEDPQLVAAAIRRYGAQRVTVALDARAGQINVRGWQSQSTLSLLDLARQLLPLGLRTVIHTDIGRDGLLTGLNVSASAELARQTGLEVIASGGLATLDDIRRAKNQADPRLAGVIIGRAIYDGRVDLSQAIALAEEESGC